MRWLQRQMWTLKRSFELKYTFVLILKGEILSAPQGVFLIGRWADRWVMNEARSIVEIVNKITKTVFDLWLRILILVD